MWVDGKYVHIEPAPHDTGSQGELHKQEIRETTRDAINAIKEARTALDKVIANPAATKTKLREIAELLRKAEREAGPNLEFTAGQACEAIDRAKNNAMTEVDQYIGMRLQEFGGDALRKLLPGLKPEAKRIEGAP